MLNLLLSSFTSYFYVLFLRLDFKSFMEISAFNILWNCITNEEFNTILKINYWRMYQLIPCHDQELVSKP